jgi:hypothetical protein
MKRRTFPFILFILAIVSKLISADPSIRIIAKLSSDELRQLLQSEGYSVRVDKDLDTVWMIDGKMCHIVASKSGSSIAFFVAYKNSKTTLAKINEWNKDKRFSRTYLDEDGDPVLQIDLDLSGGVTIERIRDFFTTCKLSFEVWRKEVIL